MIIRGYREEDIPAMTAIWNEVVEEGVAFPQEDFLTERTGAAFFGEQSYCGVAQQGESGEILGLYILHPNNVGRCGHICNASYAVASGSRGRHIGEKLVLDCIEQAGADRLPGFAVQCGGRVKYPCETSVRESRVYAAWHDPGRVSDEGRAV